MLAPGSQRVALLAAGFSAGILTLLLVFLPRGVEPIQWDLELRKSVLRDARLLSQHADDRRDAIRTPSELLEFREHVREGLLRALYDGEAAFTETRPLRVITAGKSLDRPAYSIQNLSYESIPGHWVPANLYIPKDVVFPVPGIVCVSDHAEGGKSAPYNQRQGAAFAERGYVAIVIDSPDRGELRGGNDHFVNGAQLALTGLWSNVLFVTNARRAIDYLSSRTDLVDPQRIGVTGTSGGGATTALVAAIDERVTVAVPCCFLESFEQAVCNGYTWCPEFYTPGGMTWPMEWPDIISLAIPRGMAPTTALKDQLFTQKGFDEGVTQAANFYQTAGVPDNFRVIRTREEHTYSAAMREAAFYWFAHWLGTPKQVELPPWTGKISEPDEVWFTLRDDDLELESAEDLAVDFPNSTNLHSIALARANAFAQVRLPLDSDKFGRTQAERVRGRVKSFFDPPMHFTDLTFTKVSSKRSAQRIVEELVLESKQHGIRIPATWTRPADGKIERLVLYLDEKGSANLGEQELGRLVAGKFGVLAADLRGFGQLAPRASKWDKYEWCDIRRALSFGLWSMNSSVPELQVADAQVCLQFLTSESVSAGKPIYVVGIGCAAPIALFSAAIRPEVHGVLGQGAIVSYLNYVQQPLPDHNPMGLSYGILKEFDIPEVLASVADKLLLWSDPIDASGEPVSRAEASSSLQLPIGLVRHPETVFSVGRPMDFANVLTKSDQ